MDEKKVTSGFEQKQSYVRAETLSGLYADIEKDFEEVNEILAEAGIGPCCYVPQKEKAEKIVEDYCKLNAYVLSALQQALDELDKPLYLNFKNNATETLSEIRLSEITTEVTFNICEYSDVSAIAALSESKEMLAVLSIEDFISLDDCDKFQGLVPIKGIETFELFADSFQEHFDSVSLYEGMSINKCIKTFLKIGEFDHVAYHPGKDLLSAILDVTIIKPIIEMIVGYDLITEERLSTSEKVIKGVGAVLDVGVLALSLTGLGQAGLTGKAFILKALKVSCVEVTTDAVATSAAFGAKEIGASPIASAAVGIVTGTVAGSVVSKLVIPSSQGLLVSDAAFVNTKLNKMLKKADITEDEFEIMRLTPVDELTIKERYIMKQIRDSVSKPKPSTKMVKILPTEDMEKYIGESGYKSIGGFVAKYDDVAHISGYDDIVEGMRLDYVSGGVRAYPENGNSYCYIVFRTDDVDLIEIPYGKDLGGIVAEPYPCMQNGFTAARNGNVIPEWYIPKGTYVGIEKGAKLHRVVGSEDKVIAIYRNGYFEEIVH